MTQAADSDFSNPSPLHLSTLLAELDSLADMQKSAGMLRFFKTGPGTYGENEYFRGIAVPNLRILADRYARLDLAVLRILLRSLYHEDRMLALLILVNRYKKANRNDQNTVCRFYLKCTPFVNSWDLVDVSAPPILGAFLYAQKKRNYHTLFKLADSDVLWERRIAMVATLYFIRKGVLKPAFDVALKLLEDPEDLIHKAVGWMLRETRKINPIAQEFFLQKHYYSLHRTTLRYAIEHFPEEKRRLYLQGQFRQFKVDWRE